MKPRKEATPVSKLVPIMLTLLEKQGLAVVLLGFTIGWVSGWIPFRLCEPQVVQGQVIQAMERDRGEVTRAVNTIATAVARMDARDAIKTCSSIFDKDARVACIQVAVTAK